MTAVSKSANKLKFQTGDTPTQADFEDLIDSYQDVLESGTNIKTVNGNSLLGSGNISISGGATNLTSTPSPTTVLIESDSGTDVTLIAADGTNAGLLLPAEKTKIAAIDTDLALKLSITNRVLQVAFSDEVTPIVTGTSKVSFFAPYSTTIQEIWVGLGTAQSSGSIFTVDVNINGVTMLSTKITVDNTETTSLTAVTAPVISVPGWTKGDKITIDVDQVGNGTALGGKIIFRG